MAEDVKLTLGGDAHALMDALLKGGNAFTEFAKKTSTSAEALGKKMREISGADLIAQANEYVRATNLIGGAVKLTTAEKTKLNATLTTALEKYKALGVEAPAAMRELEAQTRRLLDAEKSAAAEATALAAKVKDAGDAAAGAGKSTGLLDATLGKLVASFTAANIIDRGIGMLVSWGKEAVASAAKTVDLANKTGNSTEYIQRMAAASDATGVSLESLGQASFQLGVRVENGGKKARDAAEDLGIEWSKLKAASPDEKMRMVMAALEAIEDPTRRNTLAMALYGGAAKEAAQAAADGYTKAADAARVSSDAQIRALDAAGEAWSKFLKDAQTSVTSALGAQVLLVQNRAEMRKQLELLTEKERAHYYALLKSGEGGEYLLELTLKRLAAEKKALEEKEAATKKATVVEESYVDTLKKQTEAVAALSKEQRAELLAADKLGKVTDDLLDKYNLTTTGLELLKEQTQKHTEATKQAAEKTKQLADEEKKRQDQLFGRDLITRANQYVKELGGVENLTKLSKDQTDKLALAVAAALAAYQRLGEQAPAALKNLGAATVGALAGFEKNVDILALMNGGFDRTPPQAGFAGSAGFENDPKFKIDITKLLPIDKNDPKLLIRNWTLSMTKAAEQLPAIIAQAFTSGGGWAGALSGSASSVGAAAVGHLVGQAGKTGLTKGMTGLMGNMLSAAGPVIGALAGPLIETLVKAFHKPEHKRIMQDVGRQWGVDISEGLAKKIEADAAKLFGKDRVAGSLFNLDAIIKEAGGLSDGNLDKFTRRLRDVFVLFQEGKFTASEAAQVIDKNWSEFAKHHTDASGRISASLKEIIALNNQLGVQSKEIAAWQQGQATTAITGFNAVVAGMAKPWVELGEAVDKAKQKTKEATEAHKKAAADRATSIEQLDKLKKAIEEAAAEEKELGKVQSAEAKRNKQLLEDLGTQAVATFAAAVASGMSFAAALKLIAPGAKDLKAAFKALGIETDNVALKTLLLQSSILEKNPELIGAIDGLGQQMIALDNLGLMNAETFNALQRTGLQAYQRLQAEVAAVGGTTRDALLPMQTYLQEAARQAELLGIPLDANTQMLIDQSKELGIWQDKGKSATQLLTDAVTSLRDVMQQVLDRLNGVSRATSGLASAANQIPDDPFKNWSTPHLPNVDGYTDFGDPIPGHARGGVFSRPHVGLIAEGGEAEIIGSVPFMTRALEGALAQIASMERSVSQPVMPSWLMASGLGGAASQAPAAAAAQTIVEETVNLNFHIQAFDGEGVQQAVEKKILPAFTAALTRGRGLRDFRVAAGIK